MDNFSTSSFGAGADPFTRFWTDCIAKMTGAGLGAAWKPSEDAMSQIRRAFFDAWANHCDEFMRSPAFLEAMKRSMDGALAFREQLNEFMTRVLHESQSPARIDTDSIMLVLRSLEEHVLDRLDRLESKIEALEERPPSAQREASRPVSHKHAPPRRKGGGE